MMRSTRRCCRKVGASQPAPSSLQQRKISSFRRCRCRRRHRMRIRRVNAYWKRIHSLYLQLRCCRLTGGCLFCMVLLKALGLMGWTGMWGSRFRTEKMFGECAGITIPRFVGLLNGINAGQIWAQSPVADLCGWIPTLIYESTIEIWSYAQQFNCCRSLVSMVDGFT